MVNDSEQLPHIIKSPEFVITLVHGTFAPNAGWTREGSQFRQMLMEQIGPNVRVHFEEFKWIGFFGTRLNNSHTHRLAAGESLRRRLLEVQASFPYSHHFIVAHSHGGNVALYALREESIKRRLSGLVCLATPFLQPKGRDYETVAELVNNLVPVGLAAVAFFAWIPLGLIPAFLLAPLINWVLHYTSGLLHTILDKGQIFTLLLGIPLDLFLYRIAVAWVKNVFDLTEMRLRQQDALSRLSLAKVTQTSLPLFCGRVSGDEAKWGLGFVRSLVDLPFYGCNIYLYCVVFIILCVLVFGGGLLSGCGINITENPITQKLLLLVLCLFFIGPVIAFCFIAVANSNLNFLRLLMFGSEAVMDSLLLRLEVKPSVDGCDCEHVYRIKFGIGLKHCQIYEQSEVIRDIAYWLHERAAVTDSF